MPLTTRNLLLLLTAFFCVHSVCSAQDTARVNRSDTARHDSTRIYTLGTVTVTDRQILPVQPLSTDQVLSSDIRMEDATSVSEIVHEVPAARVQTNSRGESIIYLRNAGERQVSLFFDGALLNVPWDNRIDLSLVPLNAVGGMVVAKGVPSVLYGPNTMGGAVNLVTRELASDGSLSRAEIAAGQGGLVTASASHMARAGLWNMIAAASLSTRDGITLSESAELPFNQPDSPLRLNTDRSLYSGYLRGEYASSQTSIGLSLNAMSGEKGIAPEGHRDPEIERVRFWRYPEWQYLISTLNLKQSFGSWSQWQLRSTVWASLFEQQIEQFSSATYSDIAATQDDRDLTIGGRFVFNRDLETGDLAATAMAVSTRHSQVDSDSDGMGNLVPEAEQEYGQQTLSTGLEYTGAVAGPAEVTAGIGIASMITTASGDKPKQDPFTEWDLTLGMAYPVDESITIRGAAGRKSRFPSLRELYGEALGRFLVNPDLTSEHSWNAEGGVAAEFDDGRFEVTGFAQFAEETIDQRVVDTLGGALRQRINLPGSRVYGIESSVSLRLAPAITLDGHLTWSRPRGLSEDSTGTEQEIMLSERPEWIGGFTVAYNPASGLGAAIDGHLTDGSVTLNDINEFVPLRQGLVLDARVSYRILPRTIATILEAYLRVSNLLDTYVEQQLGLPEEGRSIRGGLKVTI